MERERNEQTHRKDQWNEKVWCGTTSAQVDGHTSSGASRCTLYGKQAKVQRCVDPGKKVPGNSQASTSGIEEYQDILDTVAVVPGKKTSAIIHPPAPSILKRERWLTQA